MTALRAPSQPAHSTAREWVLIADMDVRRAREIAHVFRSRGFLTTIVRNGHEVLPLLRRANRPLLLVLNLGLPVVDGLTLLRQAIDANTIVPVIALADATAIQQAVLRLDIPHLTVLPTTVSAASLESAAIALLERPALRPIDTPTSSDGKPSCEWVQAVLDDLAEDLTLEFDVFCAFVTAEMGSDLWCGVSTQRLTKPLRAGASPLLWPIVSDAAKTRDLLVVPDLTTHPAFSSVTWPVMSAVQGVAVMPMLSAADTVIGAACLLSLSPLTLTADELQRFRTLIAAAAANIDRRLATAEAAHRVRSMQMELLGTRAAADARIAALTDVALKDPLTGLLNRRGGEDALAREAARVTRSTSPCALVVFDVDNFKAINDAYGHAAGDAALRTVAAVLEGHQRAGDLAVRWGGEEFLVILPGETADGARVYAERVRAAVEASQSSGLSLTVSAGVGEILAREPHVDGVARADEALYAAKRAGRNRVV